MSETSLTYELTNDQQEILLGIMVNGNFRKREVPYSVYSIEGENFNATLYAKEKHGKRKLCIQGRGAKEFVEFQLEPKGVVPLSVGYEAELNPEAFAPRGGSDESGKGDYFGPLVVCCAYADASIAEAVKKFTYIDAQGRTYPLPVVDCKAYTDSKSFTADQKILMADEKLRRLLGPNRYWIVKRSPANYNRKYARIGNINQLLAKAHCEGIEEFLDRNRSVNRVVIDQFARTEWTIRRELGEYGKRVKIDQHHKAESDLAVAIASVIARAEFIRDIRKMSEEVAASFSRDRNVASPLDTAAKGDATFLSREGKASSAIPMGSSDPRVVQVAAAMVKKFGPTWLMNHCKVHFQTTDKVLAACGLDRSALPPEGRIESKSNQPPEPAAPISYT